MQEAVIGLQSPYSLCSQQHQRNGQLCTGESGEQNNWYHGATPYIHTATTRLPPPSTRNSPLHPATSCQDAFEKYRNAPSGYYWISRSGSASPVRVYCSMSLTCGNQTGGLMRVANIDMRNNSHTCPSGLSLISAPKRLCDVTSVGGCVSNMQF